ncbi:NADH-quinone oxidoreductase subunit NuoN [Actinomadura sp. 7K507]|uniref:NADH-quinone oxidoreductase subunit NuoN n=1 Tax=Actinomadura sp. 7K507 TaxID=2530365 RepID=UPI0010534D5E|nr:NADH-quinone oxidoreductase subunit NuoN [Actinomadura sp. 7K507]TDC92225.1 NADH-quinone oxidoreductase subunit NuoN [Actinomadura sp. 7K507]
MSTSSQVSAVLAQGGDIPAPHIEYGQIAPMLLVFGAALLGVLVEAFVGRRARYHVQVPIAFLGIAGAFVWTVMLGWRENPHQVAAEGALGVDGPTLFLQGTILILALVSLLLIADRGSGRAGVAEGAFAAQASALPGSEAEQRTSEAGITQTEVYPLMMFAVGGMIMFPAANDLLTMFVALEVLSLPLYLLCGLARRRRLLSQEASVKYFLLGAFSSAFFLYGIALLYGYAGSVRLSDISAQIGKDAGNETLLLAGAALLSVGLLFKLGGVPFHMWKPDVYQGAPTPITALMASCTVVSAAGALLRVYYVTFETLAWDWRPLMWGVAILTMVAGSIIAITQTDIKRMLAYSSIAHAGFLLLGVIASSENGLSSTLFYLLAYGFASVGAFAVVTMVRDAGGEAGHLSRWAGLGKRSPVVAGVFAFFLLAFAGIPLTSGFTGKFAIFKAAVEEGATPLVVVAVVASAVAAFFYVRVIVVMFFSEPDPDGPVVVAGPATAVAVAIGVTATVVLGVLPQPILDLAGQATTDMFVR